MKFFLVGITCFAFSYLSNAQEQKDNTKILICTKSQIVTAGTRYDAQVYFLEKHKYKSYTFYFGGRIMTKHEDGSGIVAFKASGGYYDSLDLVAKKWKVSVKAIDENGEEHEFYKYEEYYVEKPKILFEATFGNVVYRGCENRAQVDVPSLGEDYNPRFSVGSGNKVMINPKKKGAVIIVPGESIVKSEEGELSGLEQNSTTSNDKFIRNRCDFHLSVSSGGSRIGSIGLYVQDVPMPDFQFLVGDKEVDSEKGLNVDEVLNLKVQATASSLLFIKKFPKDSEYYVSNWNVSVIREGKTVVELSGLELNAIKRKVERGDYLQIKITEVKRTNFLGEELIVPVGNQRVFNLPVN